MVIRRANSRFLSPLVTRTACLALGGRRCASGQMSRKLYALQLRREGFAPKILFSVGRFQIRRFSKMALPIELDLLKLAQDLPPPRRHFFVLFQGKECHVEDPTEIVAQARWLSANPGVQSLMIISNETHQRRIRMCCRSLLPRGVEIARLPPRALTRTTRTDRVPPFSPRPATS
jgi:hypothetical protein